jgi:hypothetical protein
MIIARPFEESPTCVLPNSFSFWYKKNNFTIPFLQKPGIFWVTPEEFVHV